MYISVKEKGKTIWTHTSLLSDDKALEVTKLQNGSRGFQNKFTFISTYLSLEAVNRIKYLKALPFYYRAAGVAGILLTSRFASPVIYNHKVDSEVKRNLDGAPIFEEKWQVPELDKKFFFIDDENNYQPSLWHHGMQLSLFDYFNSRTNIDKPKNFYHYQ